MSSGIYIHVPFCRRRCPYCDFAFVVRKEPPYRRYTDALLRELQRWPVAPTESLYLGGGTPSMLPEIELGRILSAVPLREQAVITVEANPEDAALLPGIAGLGVGRLSLGIQSLQPAHLQALGRHHSAEQGIAAVECAQAAGFHSISADLIFGVPGQTVDDLLADARQLIDAGVHHVSAYGLTVHDGTPLGKAMRKGTFTPIPDALEREHFLRLHEFLTAAGFEHYEISSYARPGHRSYHNELYWTGASYRGYGPAAHSFDATTNRRFWNLRSLDRWLQAMASPDPSRSPVGGEEFLDGAARATERLYLGLRRVEGIAWDDFPALLAPPAAAVLVGMEDHGLIRRDAARLRLTVEGMAVADAVVDRLLGVAFVSPDGGAV